MSLSNTHNVDGTLTIQYRRDLGTNLITSTISGASLLFIAFFLWDSIDEVFLWVIFILALGFFLYCILGFFTIETIKLSKEAIVTYSRPFGYMGQLSDGTLLVKDIEDFISYVSTTPKGYKNYYFCAKLISGEDKTIFWYGDEELVNQISKICQDFFKH